MFVFTQFLGIGNCASVIPFVATERTIVYREMFARMYSAWAYAFAQVTIEIPYVFIQVVIFTAITYSAIEFYWSIDKVFWYFYISFCTMLYFTNLGMVVVCITPDYEVVSVLSAFLYTSLTLFLGFLIPEPRVLNVQYSIPEHIQLSAECCHLISRIFDADPSKVPRRPGSNECGYYVTRFIRDIMEVINVLHNNFNGKEVYLQSEIDEVRDEWALQITSLLGSEAI